MIQYKLCTSGKQIFGKHSEKVSCILKHYMNLDIYLRIIILNFQSHQIRIVSAGLGMGLGIGTDSPVFTLIFLDLYSFMQFSIDIFCIGHVVNCGRLEHQDDRIFRYQTWHSIHSTFFGMKLNIFFYSVLVYRMSSATCFTDMRKPDSTSSK